MDNRKSEVYLKYLSYCGTDRVMKLSGYSFEGEPTITDFGVREIPEGKIRILKCKCGCNNWTDNGRFINEYECGSCGQFVEAYEKQS